MRRSIVLLFFIVFQLSILILSSCDKTNNDPPADVRTPFLGAWTCNEVLLGNYPVYISLDSTNSSQVLIQNFHDFGSNEKAYAIATQNSLTLPTQVILNNTFYGSGTLVNNNKITMKYYVNNHTDIDTINAVYTK
jgi:hypothetical protein